MSVRNITVNIGGLMPRFHEEEVLRSGTAGVFTPHSLILNIESMADLFPEGISIEDDPTFPQVIALHVHEYITTFTTLRQDRV
jgi:hypothetical protein